MSEPRERRSIWTDADVAAFFHISCRTLRRRMNHPVAGEMDLAEAEPKVIGGRRFWVRDNIYRIAGIKTNNTRSTI